MSFNNIFMLALTLHTFY